MKTEVHSRAEALHQAALMAGKAWPPLLLAAQKMADTLAAGLHGQRRVGHGETFWQFRRYQPGDPVSRIDWRTSARMPHCYMRDREVEAPHSVYLWADQSGSMQFQSQKKLPSKMARAQVQLLALASLLLRGGERVGLLSGNVKLATTRQQLLPLALGFLQENSANFPSPRALPRRSALIIASDFLSPPEMWEKALAPYRGVAETGVLLHILDPAELNFPYTGTVMLRGCEGEEAMRLPRAEALRQPYRKALAAQSDAMASIARHAGWSYIRQSTSLPASTALLAPYLALTGGAINPYTKLAHKTGPAQKAEPKQNISQT